MRILLKSQEQNPYSKYNDELLKSRYFTMDGDEVVSATCNYTRIFTTKRFSSSLDASYNFYRQKWQLPYDMVGAVERENGDAQKTLYKIYSPSLNQWIFRSAFVEAHSLPKKELE